VVELVAAYGDWVSGGSPSSGAVGGRVGVPGMIVLVGGVVLGALLAV